MKNDYINQFEQAQYSLYTYVEWLYKSGRLTQEEYGILVDRSADCIIKGVTFGAEEAA